MFHKVIKKFFIILNGYMGKNRGKLTLHGNVKILLDIKRQEEA